MGEQRQRRLKADASDALAALGLVLVTAGVALLWGWPVAVLVLGVLCLAVSVKGSL